MDYWEKLKNLPYEIVKKEGRLTGIYAIRLSVDGGVFFLEYIYNGELFGDYGEARWPNGWSGDSFEEVIDKATKFFEDNFGKYECIKWKTEYDRQRENKSRN